MKLSLSNGILLCWFFLQVFTLIIIIATFVIQHRTQSGAHLTTEALRVWSNSASNADLAKMMMNDHGSVDAWADAFHLLLKYWVVTTLLNIILSVWYFRIKLK